MEFEHSPHRTYAEIQEANCTLLMRDVPSIIAEALVRYGIVRQRHYDESLNGFWRTDFDKLSYRWLEAYGCLDIAFDFNPRGARYLVFDRRVADRHHMIRGEALAAFIAHANSAIHLIAAGIVQENNICACQAPYHASEMVGPFPRLLHTCVPAADKWFCHDCAAKVDVEFGPLALPSGLTRQQRTERDKMSVKIRLEVLERDQFACRACGRSAREDGVKLHVDHILAIANGGKTELTNLHTLCQDCNLGKSDKRVEQMEIWD